MATQKDFIMSRSGPEDALVAVRTNVNSSGLRTAGPDWAVLSNEKFQMDSLDYPDIAEQQRLSAQVLSAGPSGQILRELISRRDICARQAYVNTLCTESVKAHQLKQCTPTALDYVKCGTKLARAVDTLCRKPFWDYHACVSEHGKGAPACMKQWVSFDQCTENF